MKRDDNEKKKKKADFNSKGERASTEGEDEGMGRQA